MKTTLRVIACLAFLCVQHELMAQRFHLFSGKGNGASYYEDDEEPEDSIRGLSIGLNLGSYFASAKTANVYNGSGPFEGYLNEAAQIRWYSIPERIDDDGAFAFDQNTVNVIKDFYATASYGFNSDFAPTNMRYNPAMYVGLNLKWNFNRYAALVMNVNGTKLKSVGQFTMQVAGSSINNTPNSQGIELLTVAGEEQRFNMNLGYRQGWMMGDMSNFFVQIGGSMLGTRWMRNYVLVADRQFDLISQSFALGQQPLSATPTTGIGFGAFVQTGVEFWIGRYSFDIGIGFSRETVKIHTFEKNVTNKWIQATFNI
jgi:hypothetical protein